MGTILKPINKFCKNIYLLPFFWKSLGTFGTHLVLSECYIFILQNFKIVCWPLFFLLFIIFIFIIQLAKSTNFTLVSLWLYKKIGVSTSNQNLIHFAIRCHRENVWVLQLNIAGSEKNIVYYALRGRNWTFHVECDVSLPYIIFIITQIHRVRFVSVNRVASRVKPSKKNFEKKLEKNVEKQILEKKFWKKKMLEKNHEKKNFGKSKTKKNEKINYKTKIFITKIYRNIDKCHTIFALLAPFDKSRPKDRE